MVGDITQKEIIQIALILGFSYLIVQVGKALIRKSIHKTYSHPTERESRVTGLKFLHNTLSFLVYTFCVIAIIYTIPPLKYIGRTLFAGAGIFAAIVGFASQQAFSNIIGGIFLVISKPFRVGDLIRVGTLNEGFVEDITLRHTIIKDFENKRIVIPNSLISTETIHNATLQDPRIMNRIPFGISYDSNANLAIDIIREEAKAHENFRDHRNEEEKLAGESEIDIRIVSWDESSVTLRAYVWTDSQMDGFFLRTDLLKTVKERFESSGIEIPFPHRTLVYKHNEQYEKK
jgi:small-conductance mechanosensitive channel